MPQAFKKPQAPRPSHWYRVELNVAVEVMRPVYDVATNGIVKQPVTEGRVLAFRVVAKDATLAGKAAIELYLSQGQSNFDREISEVRLTDETPQVVTTQLWSKYEKELEARAAEVRAANHKQQWPSDR